MSDKPIVHVWITRYALTSGVFEVDAKLAVGISNHMVSWKDKSGYSQSAHKPDWHTSKTEADTRVAEMIDKKIKSLEASLKKMKALKAKLKATP